MKIIEHRRGEPPIFITTEGGDWNEWMFIGEWYNLMGMSWEESDPPEELAFEFDSIVKHYRKCS